MPSPRLQGLTFLILAMIAAAPATAQEEFLQVQMHVWISETTEQGLRDIGTNLTYKRFAENGSDNIQQISTNVFDPLNPLFNVTLPAPDQDLFLPPLRPDEQGNLADGVQAQEGMGMNFTLIEAGHGQLDGIFRGIEKNNDIDLISKPELLVIAGKRAVIEAGGKVPFQDVQYNPKGVASLNVTFQDIGVTMHVTPTIAEDNLIQLHLEKLEVTDIARFDNVRGIDLPVFSMRSQTGLVLVPNGQALVIGGLSTRVTRRSERRVPVLGRLPILGIPFRSRQSEVINSHLMIFVLPTIVDLRKMAPSATNALEFWRNGSWKNEATILEEIQLMESER